jgi:hypothetical protein
MKRWIAARLCPDMAKDAAKYHFLKSEIVHADRWLASITPAAMVLTWLLGRDHDHWRKLDEPSVAAYPADISAFREELRRVMPQQPR